MYNDQLRPLDATRIKKNVCLKVLLRRSRKRKTIHGDKYLGRVYEYFGDFDQGKWGCNIPFTFKTAHIVLQHSLHQHRVKKNLWYKNLPLFLVWEVLEFRV